jgi:import inner membrane translocase subunit TIM50
LLLCYHHQLRLIIALPSLLPSPSPNPIQQTASAPQASAAAQAASSSTTATLPPTPSNPASTALKLLGGSIAAGGAYIIYQTSTSDQSTDDVLRASPLGRPYAWLYDSVFSPFINPSREKLLPDWHSIPNIPPDAPCPPTLVLDLEDTLVHATWDPKFGWRYAKRPGVDRFLQDLSKYYEIVLFSPSNFGVVDPITWTLDKQGLIMHRLYKDSTRFYQGKHVKDLSKLNRDLRKVIIIDDDPDAFQFQPQNGIRIKPFKDPKDKSDRSLDKLRSFLLALVMEGVSDDIPSVLKQFQGLDADQIGDAYQSMLRQAQIKEMEKHQKGLGGLLRSQKAFQSIGHPLSTPPAAAAAAAPSRLSAKDIVGQYDGGNSTAAAAAVVEIPDEVKQSAPPPPGPVKKGKVWGWYQEYMREAEEDQRRKLELWSKKQQQREEEARRQAMAAQAAGGR